MRKWIFTIFVLGLILNGFSFVFAQEKVELHFFYSRTCPNCAAEQEFLKDIEEKYPEVRVNRYLVSDPKSQELLRKLCKECDAERYIGLVPLTFIEGDFFLGFDNPEGIGKKIEQSIQRHLQGLEKPLPKENQKLAIPILGEIDVGSYSFLALAVILGFLDGFNVCSLGALILILGLVLALRSRRKALIYGGIFILTTTVIYGFLIFLWYQIFSLIASYIIIIQILIGILALLGGVYFLRQFLKFKKTGAVCELGSEKLTLKFSQKIESALKGTRIVTILAAIILFAAVITIVEFPCSAAVPVVFAGILVQAELPTFLYLLYIALFLLFYMLDEIIVFLAAVFTMKIWVGSNKFVTWLNLAAAIILIFFGIYYLLSIF